MTALHTPGPWKLVQNWTGKLAIVGPGNNGEDVRTGRIANCPGGASRDATVNALGHANGRLISAAPDLLEALLNAEAIWEDECADGVKWQWLKQARAAIAKALVAAP